jgi:hypothetical protein
MGKGRSPLEKMLSTCKTLIIFFPVGAPSMRSDSFVFESGESRYERPDRDEHVLRYT